jgi:outer membrane protein TolC
MRAQRWLGVTTAALWMAFGSVPVSGSGTERLEVAVQAAMEHAPAVRLGDAESTADRASSDAETAGLAPYVEWQSEGFGPGFDRRPNAQDTLRVGTTVEPFWSLGRRGDVRSAAARTAEHRAAMARIETGWAVTERWVEAAALIEEAALADRRLERMTVAIEQQRRRLELGEISGSELLQFEAILAEAALERATLGARWEGLSAELIAMVGREVPLPQPGDLEDLTRMPGMIALDAASMPQAAAATSLAEAERARADWLGALAWGRPTVELEWERFPDLDGLQGYDAWGLRVNVPLPFGGGGAFERDAAQARALASEVRADAAVRATVARLAVLDAREKAGEASLEALDAFADTVVLAERSLEEQYLLGELGYVGLLDGLDRLARMQQSRIDAQREIAMARLERLWLMGGAPWVERAQQHEEVE